MKPNKTFARMVVTMVVATLTLVLGACASRGTAPIADLTNARASISQAESAGATQLAPVELLTARDKLGRAEAAARAENFAEAKRLADQAVVDAEVAERKARAEKALKAAEELSRANATLEKEIARKSQP